MEVDRDYRVAGTTLNPGTGPSASAITSTSRNSPGGPRILAASLGPRTFTGEQEMRSILLYGPLVGLPILGVTLVLEFGRGLTAAPSVAGRWSLTVPVTVDTVACPAARGLWHATAIEVRQSGAGINLTLVGSGSGSLPGHVARGADGLITVDVSTGSVSFHAIVDRSARPTRLIGSAQWPGCDPALRADVVANSQGIIGARSR